MKDNPEKYKKNKETIADYAGGKLEGKDLYPEYGKGTIKIDHKKVAHLFIKMITLAPLHPIVKKIMRLRLIGTKPLYRPFSPLQVALNLGLREEEVVSMEKEGLYILSDYHKKCCLHEASEEFNQNSRVQRDLKNDLENS